MRLEQQGAERRGERQRDNTRKHHRHRDRYGKLLVHLPRKAAHERNRNKHGAQHKHNGDNRGRNFVHGLCCRLSGRQMLRTHDTFNVFKHNDGVVHHDTDGKHQSEQRKRVDGVAKGVQARERADNGHRHGNAGNERGAPVLQKDVNNDEHQDHGFDQGTHHFLDGFDNEVVVVHQQGVSQTIGHARGNVLQLGLYQIARGDGVGARQQIHGAHACAHAVVAGKNAVVLAAQFYARHILEPQHGAVVSGADDDFAKFFRRYKAALSVDLPGKLGGVGRGHVAQTSRGVLRVLLLNGRGYLLCGNAVLGELVRLQPDTHGVVHAAKKRAVAHAVEAFEFVNNVDLGPVVDEHVAIAPVGRIVTEHLQHGGRTLDDRDALPAHIFRQGGLGQVNLVVNVDQGHVGITAQLEVHIDVARAGTRSGNGSHVEHVFHTVDIHFKGSQNRGGNGFRRSAGVRHAHVDRGRHKVGVLCDGQGLHGQRAHQGYDNRDNGRQNRPAQKEIRLCRNSHMLPTSSARHPGAAAHRLAARALESRGGL